MLSLRLSCAFLSLRSRLYDVTPSSTSRAQATGSVSAVVDSDVC